MSADPEVQSPSDTLNKLSQALVLVSRGDPLVALRNELSTQFGAIEARIVSVVDSLETRFDAIDKATTLQHEDQTRVPTQIDKAIIGLRELLEQMLKTYNAEVVGDLRRHVSETTEKFAGVAAKFSDVATRTDQRAGDIKLAVDAAFAAAKETTAKIETGFTKQIDSMSDLIDTKTTNLEGNIGDLKDRLIAIESKSKGGEALWGYIVGAVGAIGVVAALFFELARH